MQIVTAWKGERINMQRNKYNMQTSTRASRSIHHDVVDADDVDSDVDLLFDFP